MANTEEQLRTILQDVAKKENYSLNKIDIKPISSGGANYSTDLYICTISEPTKPDIDIFAKAAIINEEVRKNNEMLARVYEVEAWFYSEMVNDFQNIYNKYQVPIQDRLVLPKYYGHVLVPYQEILLLENLEARGFRIFDRMKTFNWEYASTAVTQIARFHALGISYRKEYPVEFEKNYDKLTVEFPMDPEVMNAFMQQGMKNICEGLNDDYKQRLMKFFSEDNMRKIMKLFLESKTMMVHADFRPSNLMHRRRNGKLEVIILDYQTIKMGHPVNDLFYFIFSGSDEEFRRLHYQRLLDHYFTQLTLALKQLRIDVEEVYPKKTYDADLIEMKPLGLMFGVSIVGLVTVAPEDAPKMEGDIADMMQIKPNQLAQERIKGIMNDFVRWGIL